MFPQVITHWMEVLKHSTLHRLQYSFLGSNMHVKTRSPILALALSALFILFTHIAYSCASPLVCPCFQSSWCCSTSSILSSVNSLWWGLWNIHSAGIRIQEAALGTNHAENPLISEVTITCGMLTWYRTRWCFRWGAPHMGKHGISALNSHDKGTKPVLWSLSSIMTGCMSSIGTDLCLQCWGLWSSEALYSTVEYNVKYCCSAWNLSSFINANIQIWEVHVHIS